MNYFLLKFRFNSPLHIGDSGSAKSLDTSNMIIRADTLFSALCHMALKVYGEKGIAELYDNASRGNFIISDTMPYSGKTLYLPKPVIAEYLNNEAAVKSRKKLKKINYLPLNLYESYFLFIEGKGSFDITETDCNFGSHVVVDKVAIRGLDMPTPYSVGLFNFDNAKNCGLYVIIGYDSDYILKNVIKLFRLIGLGGIGGKVSAGYGKYEIIEEIDINNSNDSQISLLKNMIYMKEPDYRILLTTSLPADEELEEVMEGSTYSLIRRGGFIQSADPEILPVKKQTQYFFSSGSVFKKTFRGSVYEVAGKAGHPVYRYSKPMFLGVKI